VGPEVEDLVAELAQIAYQILLQFETRVVGTKGDTHGFPRFLSLTVDNADTRYTHRVC
jgi:hypothetical protein